MIRRYHFDSGNAQASRHQRLIMSYVTTTFPRMFTINSKAAKRCVKFQLSFTVFSKAFTVISKAAFLRITAVKTAPRYNVNCNQ